MGWISGRAVDVWAEIVQLCFHACCRKDHVLNGRMTPILVRTLASLSVPFLLRLLYWYRRFETPIVFLFYISVGMLLSSIEDAGPLSYPQAGMMHFILG